MFLRQRALPLAQVAVHRQQLARLRRLRPLAGHRLRLVQEANRAAVLAEEL